MQGKGLKDSAAFTGTHSPGFCKLACEPFSQGLNQVGAEAGGFKPLLKKPEEVVAQLRMHTPLPSPSTDRPSASTLGSGLRWGSWGSLPGWSVQIWGQVPDHQVPTLWLDR